MISIRLHAISFVVAVSTLGLVACASSSTDKPVEDEPAAATPSPEVAKEHLARGHQALDDGRWQEAVDEYRAVTDAEPHRWQAHMNRGIALANLGEQQRAVEAFADAIDAGGADEPILYFNLGNLYHEQSLYENAIDAYRASMAHGDDFHYESLLNISACLTFLNAIDKARETIERAIERRPGDPRAKITLGVIEFSDGQPERALELYDEILAVDSDLAPAHYNRGFVLLRMNRTDEARRAFETYLELAPDGPYSTKAESHLSSLDKR